MKYKVGDVVVYKITKSSRIEDSGIRELDGKVGTVTRANEIDGSQQFLYEINFGIPTYERYTHIYEEELYPAVVKKNHFPRWF